MFSLCTRQRHHSVNSGGNNNNNNKVSMNNNKTDKLLWLEQPTSIGVVKANASTADRSEAAMASAARVLERRLSWSPRRCRDEATTKPYQERCISEPAAVHRAVVVDLNNCPSLSGSLDFLSSSLSSTSGAVKTVLVHPGDEKSTGPHGMAPSDQQVALVKRRFLRLIGEGDVQLCRMGHSGTVIGKILSSKFLRRWETHHLYLNDAQISSKTVSAMFSF